MHKTIKYIDEDFTEKEFEVDVEYEFKPYIYGEDADGNRGQQRWYIDWYVDMVYLSGQVYKPDIKLKVRISDFIDKWIYENGDELLEHRG